MNAATPVASDKETDITCVEDDEIACDNAVSISSDLRQAINLLRSVPSPRVTTVRPRATHSCRYSASTDRRSLRPVNEHSHRLSLSLQLPHHTDTDYDELVVRQCASISDNVPVVHSTTGAMSSLHGTANASATLRNLL